MSDELSPGQVRDLRPEDVATCGALLESLPEWFGFPEVNAGYVESLPSLPTFVAEVGDDVAGFVALEPYGAVAAEILVLAVRRELHRRGIGHLLVERAREWCRASGVPWLHVKTRGPKTPDANYERTRRFYLAEGFDPLYESLTEWGPSNAALVLVQRVDGDVRGGLDG